MADTRTTAYAGSLIAIAAAEGALDSVTEEFYALGAAVEADDQLRATLSDPKLPVERRAQVVEDLLEGKASPTTVALASMVVLNGRGAAIPEISREVGRIVADEQDSVLAEARSAVALTDEQINRLAEALSTKLGRTVTVRNVVDPSVVGGVVTQIGDEVIDGTVRTRLNQLREAF
ncbi:MAG: ATP synthase F1 subunit delta [Microthrixaceae bacterium]|nr:ATP synthase F1 subunit delta [Microthrixaceae bacterium]MCB1011257.1 ATP synthase F1 subunit delta [Microthrixaceae bacterium]MCO5321823.1 ATP synthase F1 subunit delta [Microthrixaceae bacterium]